MNYIEIKEKADKVVINLKNPPYNCLHLGMVSEIYDVIRKYNNKIIVFVGKEIINNGELLFSAGIHSSEIKEGNYYRICHILNQIATYLNSSNNYVVSIIAGSAINDGWTFPLEISDKIYYIKDSYLTTTFKKNNLIPSFGTATLLLFFKPKTVYKLLEKDQTLSFSDLNKNAKDFFEEFRSVMDIDRIIGDLKSQEKIDRFSLNGEKLEEKDSLSGLINDLLINSSQTNEVQMMHLKNQLRSMGNYKSSYHPNSPNNKTIEKSTNPKDNLKKIDASCILKDNWDEQDLHKLKTEISTIKEKETNIVILESINDSSKGNRPTKPLRKNLNNIRREICEYIEKSPVIFVFFLKGKLRFSGLSIALACDFRIANKKSRFIMNTSHLEIDIIKRLKKICGYHNAKIITFLGEEMTAQEAWEYGILTESIEEEADYLKKIDTYKEKLKKNSSMSKLKKLFK